jgi:signal transduction histidine kinase
MRERVSLLGGRMTAGTTPRGGFRVEVEIPVDGSSADPARRGEQGEWRQDPTSGPDRSEGIA